MRMSFAWTTEALVAGLKTATRRFWTDAYARGFHKGDLVKADNRQPRFGGEQVATIRLTHEPYQQTLNQMTHEDFLKEGALWKDQTGKPLWRDRVEYQAAMLDQGKGDVVWVLEFELVEIIDPPLLRAKGGK